MAESNAVVRIYHPDAETEAIINAVKSSGFAINKLSIVSKDNARKPGRGTNCSHS